MLAELDIEVMASRASYIAVFMKCDPGLRLFIRVLGFENCIRLSFILVRGPSTRQCVSL